MLAHGGGGQLTDELINGRMLPKLGNAMLNELLDSAMLDPQHGRIADDNRLVCGAAMEVSRGGYRAAGGIGDGERSGGERGEAGGTGAGDDIGGGFSADGPGRVIDSIAATAKEAGVPVITGDTKVVGRGQADGIYLITAGIGRIPSRRNVGPKEVKEGHILVINGPIGEHGLAVMLAREMPEVKSAVRSDAAPLNELIDEALDVGGAAISFMRDPTRGGLAGLCADLARNAGIG